MATSQVKPATPSAHTTEPSRAVARRWRVGWVAYSGLLAVLLGFGISAATPSPTVLLITATALVLVTPVVVRVAQGRFDPFEPIVVFAVAYGAMFVVRPAATYARDEIVYERSTRVIDISATFDTMLVLGLLGAVGFLGGYLLRAGVRLARVTPAPPTRFNAASATTMALMFAGLGVLAFLAVMATSGGRAYFQTWLAGRSQEYYETNYGGSGYLGGGFRVLCPAALALFALSRIRKSKALLWTSVGVAALYVSVTLPSGSRISLLPFVGALFIFLYVSRGRRPSGATLAVTAAVALVGVSVIYDARDAEIPLSQVATDTVEDPGRIFDPLTRTEDTGMVLAFASALTVVPADTGHTLGRATIGEFFIRPIPRALWPGKPEAPREALIHDMWPKEPVANPEFTAVMWFFMDFGALGVLAGFLVLGVLGRAIYEYFRRFDRRLVAQLLFALAIPFLVIAVRDTPVDTLARAMFFFVPMWLIFRLSATGRSAVRDGAPAPGT
jgi:hypothetical protein